MFRPEADALHTYEVSVTIPEESMLVSIRGNAVERCKMELDIGLTYLSLAWEAGSQSVLGPCTGHWDKNLLGVFLTTKTNPGIIIIIIIIIILVLFGKCAYVF